MRSRSSPIDTATLVAILDHNDSSPVAKSRSLGTRTATFDKVKTSTEVTVQLAVMMETADSSCLISDILEQTLDQCRTELSFATGWPRVTATADGLQFATEVVAGTGSFTWDPRMRTRTLGCVHPIAEYPSISRLILPSPTLPTAEGTCLVVVGRIQV